MWPIDNRIDTNETATSVLEQQSHPASNEAIVEEDDDTTATGALALPAAATTDSQTAASNTVLDMIWYMIHNSLSWWFIGTVCFKSEMKNLNGLISLTSVPT